jgi:hypothetical protein
VSIVQAVTRDKSEEKEEIGLSFRLLRSQDSLLLTKERLEHEHDITSQTEDESFFDQVATIQTSTSSSPSSVGMTNSLSPRAIVSTGTYDGFSTEKGRSPQHESDISESPITFPSLSIAKHEKVGVTFSTPCQWRMTKSALHFAFASVVPMFPYLN